MWVRGCVLAASVLGLVGCSDVADRVTDGLSRIGAPADSTSEGIRTLSLLGGDVRVRGPEGYCIDQGASNARRGFAVLVGCALISEDAEIMPSLDGMITVQFGDAETASVTGNQEAFAAFLKSDAGRGLLAGGGDLATVETVSTVMSGDGVLARFEDTSGPAFVGTTGPRWRGFLDVQDRLVTVSVLSFERDPLSRAQGERLLVVALTELIAANTPEVVAEATPEENG